VKKKDFLSITDLTATEIQSLFLVTKKLKEEIKNNKTNKEFLKNKSLAKVVTTVKTLKRLSFVFSSPPF